jgi:hypothetical protein
MAPAQSAGYLSSGVTRLQPSADAGLAVTGISPVTGTRPGFDYAEGTRPQFNASSPGSVRLAYTMRPSTLLGGRGSFSLRLPWGREARRRVEFFTRKPP